MTDKPTTKRALKRWTGNAWLAIAEAELTGETIEQLEALNQKQPLSIAEMLFVLHGLGLIDVNEAVKKLNQRSDSLVS